jgi:hypothetical protein
MVPEGGPIVVAMFGSLIAECRYRRTLGNQTTPVLPKSVVVAIFGSLITECRYRRTLGNQNNGQTLPQVPACVSFDRRFTRNICESFVNIMALQTVSHGQSVGTVGLRLVQRAGFVNFPWQNGLVLSAPSIEDNLAKWRSEEPKLPDDIDWDLLTVRIRSPCSDTVS